MRVKSFIIAIQYIFNAIVNHVMEFIIQSFSKIIVEQSIATTDQRNIFLFSVIAPNAISNPLQREISNIKPI